jgi:type IV pilus assembly protein PilA
MLDSRKCRAGFSLLELVVVVAIIGTLATIAVPMFMAHQLRSKSAEAKTNLGAITVAERAHFSESGTFLTVLPEPATIPGPRPVPFDSVGSGFAQLGYAPEGNVYFSYGVAATSDGTGYTVDAGADIDANGIVQLWGYTKSDGAGVFAPGQVGCDATRLVPLSIGPCDATAGRSVF